MTAQCIDIFLKPNLNDRQKRQFVAFKKNYFERINFCKNHETDYVTSLLENDESIFDSNRSCCKTYRHTPHIFNMKIEILIDRAIILSANCLSASNSVNGDTMIKNSGGADKSTEKLKIVYKSNLCYQELNDTLNNSD